MGAPDSLRRDCRAVSDNRRIPVGSVDYPFKPAANELAKCFSAGREIRVLSLWPFHLETVCSGGEPGSRIQLLSAPEKQTRTKFLSLGRKEPSIEKRRT